MDEGKPDHVPAHKLPAWISSADLHDEIRRLADGGTDKAACWDFTQAVYRLTLLATPSKG
jgi:hypothetical protein